MKKILAAMIGAALVLGACGGDADENEPAPANDGNNNVEETNNAADGGTYDLASGEELYQGQCAGCHGGNLEGLSGPGLVEYSHDEIVQAIQEGPGSMPADLVATDDAEDIAAWVIAQE
jgi:mono/diheme cytochrome c family protein